MAFRRSAVRARYPPLHKPLQNNGLCRFLAVRPRVRMLHDCHGYGLLPTGVVDWSNLIRVRITSARALSFRAVAKSRAF